MDDESFYQFQNMDVEPHDANVQDIVRLHQEEDREEPRRFVSSPLYFWPEQKSKGYTVDLDYAKWYGTYKCPGKDPGFETVENGLTDCDKKVCMIRMKPPLNPKQFQLYALAQPAQDEEYQSFLAAKDL